MAAATSTSEVPAPGAASADTALVAWLGLQRTSASKAGETRDREHLLAIFVAHERARLAHQRPDQMPIVDPLLVPAAQPRHLSQSRSAIQLQRLGAARTLTFAPIKRDGTE